MAAAGRDMDAGHRRGVPDPVAELRGHPQGDGGRALGDPQALPDLVGVEAVRADRGHLAQVGEQRRALDRLGRQREHRHLAEADRVGRRARLAQPVADREPVEPRRVRVRPRVVGVDGRGQRAEPLLGGVERRALWPGEPVAEDATLRQHPGVLARGRRERVDEREPELVDEPAVRRVPRADDLPAELQQPAVRQLGLLDATAGPVARLEHDHVGAGRGEVAGGREAREPGPQHRDVVAAHSASRQATSSRSGPRS